MSRLLSVLAGCAVALAGCEKPEFQSDLSFVKNGNKYDFRISVVKDTLYLHCKYNGADVGEDAGLLMAGKRIAQAAVKDLDDDGYPEVYVFYDRPSSVPAMSAVACNERACSGIGVQGAAGGPAPENYCGEDSYNIEGNLVLRNYRLCSRPDAAGDGLGTIAYMLDRNSFGYILKVVDASARQSSIGAGRGRISGGGV